jgi:hypothetical protein
VLGKGKDKVHPCTGTEAVQAVRHIGGVEVYDMIYLLTAVGLSPGGSTHLHTNNT